MPIPEIQHPHINGVQLLLIDSDAAGQRIDNFLIKVLAGVPKSHIYRLLRTGQVRINKGRVKPVYKLKTGDYVRIPPVRQIQRTKITVPDEVVDRVLSAIIFEDEQIIVLNKPAGLSVHAGTGVIFGVIDAIRQQQGRESLELVHRLDRGTSGCLIIAKSRQALLECQQVFKNNSVEKQYLALTAGRWQQSLVTVNRPLLKNSPRGGERMVEICETGKPAVSHFTLVQQYANTALVRVRIETGRTHQIRVHAAFLGHPIIGDDKYGDREINHYCRSQGLKRLYLHAEQLSLPLKSDYRFQTGAGTAWQNDIAKLAE